MKTPVVHKTASSKDRLGEIIDAVLKPLRFASKDGFVHISSVKSLEPLMARLCDEAATVGVPPGGLAELKSLFTGFDSLPVEEKKLRVSRALSLAGGLFGAWHGLA